MVGDYGMGKFAFGPDSEVRVMSSWRLFWQTLCLIVACHLGAASVLYAQDIPVPASTGFDHILGAVAVAVPDYEGSDDQTFVVAPVAKWKYDRNRYLLLQGNKLYWNMLNGTNWELGLKGVYRLGRDNTCWHNDQTVARHHHQR